MSSEELNNKYDTAAVGALSDCMDIMSAILPLYQDNTSEFILSNVYVAGGMLSACMMFADNVTDKQVMKGFMLNALSEILDKNIEAQAKHQGKAN